jgi:hypothetical protein
VRRTFAAAFVVALGLASAPARADLWEIQVYNGLANAPRVMGLEVHMNHVASGIKKDDGPERAPDGRSHLTLEPSLGVTPWWELGMYFQAAKRKSGELDYAGMKIRSKFVTPPGWHEHLRLGVNLELSSLPIAYDKNHLGMELRPIIAWENETFLFAANPNVNTALANEGAKEGPAFEPAATAVYKWNEQVGFGVEYYAAFGPFADLAPLHEQEHYIYEVFHLLSEENLELSAGVGEGLTPASNKLVFKIIVGYAFDFNGRR